MADPLLKWAGGKRRVLPAILDSFEAPQGAELPGKGRIYVEPFLGGGAVLLAVMDPESPHYRGYTRACTAEALPDVANLYRQVRDRPDDVCASVDWIRSLYDGEEAEDPSDPPWRDAYYAVRDAYNDAEAFTKPEDAARLLWLNRAGFNGLYRRSKKQGRYNVPCGRYKRLKLPSREQVHAVSRALQRVVVYDDWRDALRNLPDQDAPLLDVYADPPYLPRDPDIQGFNNYTGAGFGQSDHENLIRSLSFAAHAGGRVRVSGWASNPTLTTYAQWGATPLARMARASTIGRSNRKTVNEAIYYFPDAVGG